MLYNDRCILFSGYLATKFGRKYLFGGGVFLTAIFTLLTPLCVQSTPANNACEGVRQYIEKESMLYNDRCILFSGYLATKFGGKYLFGVGVFLTAIFTLLTPGCWWHANNRCILFSGYLASKFGGKYLFGGGVFLTAIFTLLTPLCVQSTPANNACEGVRQYIEKESMLYNDRCILFSGYLATKFGGKYLFGEGIFMTAIFTLLTPLLVAC